MQKKKVTFELEIYNSQEELSVLDRELMQAAVLARENAYAPYSGFKVGAAVLLANGEIVIGNNQENASYPSGLCAERVAVFQAGARFPGIAVKTIAISVNSVRRVVDTPAAPCGNCRQAIAEYEQRQTEGIEILMMGSTGEVYKSASITDLLPLAFGKSYLD
ncbi:cytidine deaminase [Zeaxanthinibacter enoshimensis]|uniref:Cytidine deaminase n=1 Tax=Zeaxanthinibacter enoshimensis TaxID=392009 RepID=A0A4R6TFC8_9FLAO|nr:cytidine deaminase [Zeaxanthinibacter enoshimensis]TDQ28947.1 cytidine deaminase [Zeaxanthinibacter enoshimensis]